MRCEPSTSMPSTTYSSRSPPDGSSPPWSGCGNEWAGVRWRGRIAAKDGATVYIIPVEKLDYAEAQDDYISLASGGKKVLRQQTISSLERGLDPARLPRIHRSATVNLERVAKIEPFTKDILVAIPRDGTPPPVLAIRLQTRAAGGDREPPVLHALGGDEGVGDLLHVASPAPHHQHFQTIIVIEVDVQRR